MSDRRISMALRSFGWVLVALAAIVVSMTPEEFAKVWWSHLTWFWAGMMATMVWMEPPK